MFFVRREFDCVIIEKHENGVHIGIPVETIPALGDILWDNGFTEKQIDRVLDAFDDGVSVIRIHTYHIVA